jgi:uncharacterized protein YndB with AHSA1/START domain
VCRPAKPGTKREEGEKSRGEAIMTRIERSIHIDETPETVFHVLTDLKLIPRWAVIAQDTYVRPQRMLTEQGQEFHWIVRIAGMELETDWVVKEYDPPRAVSYGVTMAHRGRLEMKQRVLDAGDGGSRVELEVDYDLPYGFLGEAFDKVVAEHRNQAAVERSLHNLRDLIEALQDYVRAA